ncbi:MAG: asparagine synthase (glutamine-hydrolyzing) [Anaerolineales bacterium]|jgi:asparagine synthase (glutamine-hydrolysing)
MCGICGAVAQEKGRRVDEAVLRKMCDLIRHRGPDDEGFYLDEHAGLGMRRLSIIDLVTGNQPVSNEDKTVWIVFNGEIYNFRELHAQLENRGHVFATKSDTEVIVHAYEEYGDQCVERFNGMFAFALWDTRRRRLLIARDHLGIKPLYYWAGRGQIVFGSELKTVIAHPAVPREVDLAAIDQFLTLEYIPAPKTIFKNIHKLLPGHRLIFEKGKLRIENYWDIPFQKVDDDWDACQEQLRALIDDAVRMQMVSDVPLGAFLSGGIDSSSVVSAMSQATDRPVKTFSIGFGDRTYNELPYARAVAKKYATDHYEEFLDPDISDLAEKLLQYLDEPFGDFSIFPTYLVSMVARRHVKVVLSGDGGDELFGGYDTYVAQDLERYYRWLPAAVRKKVIPALMSRVPPQPAKKGMINKTKRFVEGAALPSALQHTRWMMFLNPSEKSRLYSTDLASSLDGDSPEAVLRDYFLRVKQQDPLTQQQYVDIKTYLVDDILTKVDRMSMAVSLEARVPLLDYRIVEFAVNLPPEMKLYRGQTKRILRQAMAERLPGEVLSKPKQGFSIPLKHWLRGPLKPLMTDLLSDGSIRRRGYFNPDEVSHLVREHLDQSANHSHRLWALMVLELWHRQILDT